MAAAAVNVEGTMRWVALLMNFLAAIGLALAACAQPLGSVGENGGPATPRVPQRTLSIAVRGEPPSLAARPLVPFSGALNEGTHPFNATLDALDERGVAHPILAQTLPQFGTDSWRLFPDGRMETTYHLRQSLTWHDGTPLSAEDFAFAWRVYATPALGSATQVPVGQMEEVIAPDARTVVIRWRQPYPDAGELTSGFQALPRHLLAAPYRDLDAVAFTALPYWTMEYVGLGPYRLDGWEPGAFIVGQAFDGFVLGRPQIDRIRIIFIPDPQTALANILAGEVHYVGNLIFGATDGETLEQQWSQNQGGAVLYSATEFRSMNFQVRPEHADPPELIDVRVRRALAWAVDSATTVEVLSQGKGIVTHTITSPQADYYPEIERGIHKYSYDPRRTQQLLEEVGFVKGADSFLVRRDGRPLKLGVWSSAGTKNEQEAASYVDSMRRAGIDATRNVITAAQIGDPMLRSLIPGATLRGGGPGLNGLTSAEIARPENRWNGGNRYGWSNLEYDRAFEAWASALAKPERVRHIADMERILTDQLPILPNFFGASVNAHVSALEGPVTRVPEAGAPLGRIHLWRWVR